MTELPPSPLPPPAPSASEAANAYNRRLIEASLDPLVTIGPDGKITDVNTATEQATGRRREDLVGTDVSDYFTAPELARAGYQQVFREGFVRDYPLELRHVDGHVTHVLYNASTYRDEQGEVIGVFAAARDVTERRRVERRAEQETALRIEKERLLVYQSRLAAMGEMIGAIAHQWRQPLNGVGAIIQDLKGAFVVGAMDRDYLDRGVATAMSQIRYMSKTIDDFRNFFRPEKAKAAFALRPALEEAVGMLATQLAAHAIDCRVVGDDGDLVLHGHENELKQVFLNLITNARDAIEERLAREPDGPRGRIVVELGRAPGRVVIAVTDNGAGLSPEVIDRMFEPYFTTKGPGQGTGIGLYMAKMIVENSGGTIVARNIPGGAELRIEVPHAG